MCGVPFACHCCCPLVQVKLTPQEKLKKKMQAQLNKQGGSGDGVGGGSGDGVRGCRILLVSRKLDRTLTTVWWKV